jgi:hypothetical protein
MWAPSVRSRLWCAAAPTREAWQDPTRRHQCLREGAGRDVPMSGGRPSRRHQPLGDAPTSKATAGSPAAAAGARQAEQPDAQDDEQIPRRSASVQAETAIRQTGSLRETLATPAAPSRGCRPSPAKVTRSERRRPGSRKSTSKHVSSAARFEVHRPANAKITFRCERFPLLVERCHGGARGEAAPRSRWRP